MTTTGNQPISSLPITIGLDGSELVPIVQGGVTKRTTVTMIAGDVTGFVPTSRRINTVNGIAGGGALNEDLTLKLDIVSLAQKTDPVVSDWLPLNNGGSSTPVKVSPPDFYKTISGLTEKFLPASSDYVVLYSVADADSRKVDIANLGLAFGEVPEGGTAGQALVKLGSANFDSAWGTLPITGGGTGASDEATARFNLGLGNVDNTSDATKPISIAAQAALNLKAPIDNPAFTGSVAVADNISTGGTLTIAGASTLAGLTVNSAAGGVAAFNKTGGAANSFITFNDGSGSGITWGGDGGGDALHGVAAGKTFRFFVAGLGDAAIISSTSLAISPATTSTSTATGALTVAGGVGIAGALNVGAASMISNSTPPSTTAPLLTLNTFFDAYDSIPTIDWTVNSNGIPSARIGVQINPIGGADLVFFASPSFNALAGVERLRIAGVTGQTTASGDLAVTGATTLEGGLTVGNAVNINSVVGGESDINFNEAGVLKWQLAKGGSNSFFLFDAVAATTAFAISNQSFAINYTNPLALVVAGGAHIAGALNIGGLGEITLAGSSSGTATISVAAAAGSTTLQLPVGNGTSGQFLSTDGAGHTSWATVGGGGGFLLANNNLSDVTSAPTALANLGGAALAGATFSHLITTAPAGPNISGAAAADSLMVLGNGTTGQAYMTFHMPGVIATNFGMASDGNFYFGGFSLPGSAFKFWSTRDFTYTPLSLTGSQTVTNGFAVNSANLGTGAGVVTINPFLGNYQFITNNGAFTISTPGVDCAVDLFVTNGAAAGSITFSGFWVSAVGTGDALNTVNGQIFCISIRRVGGNPFYVIKQVN